MTASKQRGTTIYQRLWDRVLVGSADECWPWQGYTRARGHGQIGVGPRAAGLRGTHVVAYEAVNGPVPAGRMVCHTCDHASCCNPHHLYAGTAADNSRDAVDRGRTARGDALPQTKLTDDQVREIRARYAWGTSRALAAEFGICPDHVTAIARRAERRHVR